jgi:hypothetical protein
MFGSTKGSMCSVDGFERFKVASQEEFPSVGTTPSSACACGSPVFLPWSSLLFWVPMQVSTFYKKTHMHVQVAAMALS